MNPILTSDYNIPTSIMITFIMKQFSTIYIAPVLMVIFFVLTKEETAKIVICAT